MENDLFDFENTTENGNEPTYDESANYANADYEKLSYGRVGYRRVQRLRRKGARRGIEVPYLCYELSKPEKPRIAFWVVAIISAALFIGALIGLGFLYNELVKMYSDLSSLGEFIGTLFNPEVLQLSLGLSSVPGLVMIMVYLLVIILCALPVVFAIYFYRFVRDCFYMATCSKEEFAKGGLISSRILWLAAVLITATVIFVILLVSFNGARLFLGLIYGALAAAFLSMLIITVAEKSKANKWFAQLDERKKQNYLSHETALKRVKRRLSAEKNFWSNLGK